MQHYFAPVFFFINRSAAPCTEKYVFEGNWIRNVTVESCHPGLSHWATNNRWTRAIRFAFDFAEYKASLLRTATISPEKFTQGDSPETGTRMIGRRKRWKEGVREKMQDDWDGGKRSALSRFRKRTFFVVAIPENRGEDCTAGLNCCIKIQ